MSRRVFLHVGLPKSGTTYLQSVLRANKKRLGSEAGLLYPGGQWKDQVRAVRDVREMSHRSRRQQRQTRGAWSELAREMREWPGDSVMSMEWLCRAEPDQVRRMVRDLAPARVEVVFTLRDLGRTLPAAWTESIQNRRTWTWREFLDGVVDDQDAQQPHRFWRLHDAPELIGRWTSVLPVDQVHLVVVPRRGAAPTVLWDRFCEVLGIDGSGFRAEGLAGNESVGLASSEVLRRVNLQVGPDVMSRQYHATVVAHQLAKRGLSRRSGLEPRLSIPSDLHDWVLARAEQEVASVRASGAHVVGDLDELRPDLSGSAGIQPEDLEDAQLVDTAVTGVALAVTQRADASKRLAKATAKQLRERDRQIRRLTRRTERLTRRLQAADERIEAWQRRPWRGALGVTVRRHRLLRGVLGRVRRR